MPLKQSSSNKAFKSNLKAEIHAGKPMKQSLAIAYSTKRKNMSKGGNVYGEDMSAEANQSVKQCQACSMAEGGKCMSHGGMAEKRYAEGGEVNAMKPLQQNPSNDNLELDEQEDVGSRSRIDPGISSKEDSDLQKDSPRVSEALSLVRDIMEDRLRRRMAEGGRVEADMKASGDRRSMLVGSLENGIDEPDMSHLSNNSDEDDVNPEDGRESRGMNISIPHTMSDDMHDESNASSQDEHGEDDSLVAQILKDRKMRRRG